uniref:Uncharacterized protein n=1 Tax=Anguilla anguilla TaxID=7936 RepID=A0A0E9X487_ANGAN
MKGRKNWVGNTSNFFGWVGGHCWGSELTTVCDDKLLGGLALGIATLFHRLHSIQPFNDFSKHHMLTVQPFGVCCADEELGTIGVGPSIGHGEGAKPSMLQSEVLIRKLVAIDGLAPSSIVVCEVTALTHEVWDDTVEARPLVAKALLPSTEGTEVLCSLWDNISPQLHYNSAVALPSIVISKKTRGFAIFDRDEI